MAAGWSVTAGAEPDVSGFCRCATDPAGSSNMTSGCVLSSDTRRHGSERVASPRFSSSVTHHAPLLASSLRQEEEPIYPRSNQFLEGHNFLKEDSSPLTCAARFELRPRPELEPPGNNGDKSHMQLNTRQQRVVR